MLEQPRPITKVALKRCRATVLRVVADAAIGDIAPPLSALEGRLCSSAMQSITTLVASIHMHRSCEADDLNHILRQLEDLSDGYKQALIEAAKTTLALRDPSAPIEQAFPAEIVPDEEIAVAILSLAVERDNASYGEGVVKRVRQFPLRLRREAKRLIVGPDGNLILDRAELLASASVGVLDPAAFNAATGQRDLLNKMKLPKAAAKIKPTGCGPLSRFPSTVFRRWAEEPQFLGLLDHRSAEQRRQIEFASRISGATLVHVRIATKVSDAMIRWALLEAKTLPSGKFGAKYFKLVRWMIDSVVPPQRGLGLTPRRKWTAKISAAKALEAADEHAEALLRARRVHKRLPIPDEPEGPADRWPKGAIIAEGISIRRLWTLDIVKTIGAHLNNCLRNNMMWAQRHHSGEYAIYAVVEANEAIGAIALTHDMTGAYVIIEQGGPSNAPLTGEVSTAVRKWLAAANAAGSV